MKNSYDLIIIGGGEAGIEAALRGSELGAKVCLVERKKDVGGACVDTGTLPSKAFGNTAKIIESMKKAEKFGIKIQGPIEVDIQNILNSRIRTTRCEIGLFTRILKKHNVEVLTGTAKLKGRNLVEVIGKNGESEKFKASKILLATGSKPLEMPDFPYDGKKTLSTDDLLNLEKLPKDILIVGAGSIGCEYAYIFNELGSEVIMVEKRVHPLWGSDQEIISIMEKEFKRRGIKIILGMSFKHLKSIDSERIAATLEDGLELIVEKVLICIGRKPYTEGLDLEKNGVETGERGEILVNEMMETTAPGIYAAEDVLGRKMLTSTAKMEAAIAAENALGGKHKVDYRYVPSGVYTEPEVAAIGFSEEEAKEKGVPYIVGKCSYGALLKACSLDEPAGLIKLIFERDTHLIIGAHIIGLEATEVIHQLALAMKLGAKAEDLQDIVFNHPTISEGLEKASRAALKYTSS